MNNETEKLMEYIKSIEANINRGGMIRYDPADLRMMTCVNKFGVQYSIARKFLGVIEAIAPIMSRKIFRRSKREFPTAYTHLINGYLELEQTGLVRRGNAEKLLRAWKEKYVKESGDDLFWIYPFDDLVSPFPYKIEKQPEIRTLCMHYLARMGIVMSRMYDIYGDEYWLECNLRTVRTTLKQHVVTFNKDGSAFINYHCDTMDCTLNINTEFAHWLSMLPEQCLESEWKKIINGICILMLNEQNENGSWDYTSKIYYRSKKIHAPDCHHTGTVIFNLINIINQNKADIALKTDIIKNCNLGMKFLCERFFEWNTGKAKDLPTRRPGSPTQYSEAIYAFIEYLKSDWTDFEVKKEVEHLLPLAINNLVSLINLQNGSAPSENLLGRWTNLDSIRWGNGPSFEAIARYIRMLETEAV